MKPWLASPVPALVGRSSTPILLAEDDVVTRKMLARTLRDHGHEVIEVADGAAAWACCCGPDPPRIAILDWMMPGLSGLEVCQRLRAATDRPYTFVILVSAKSRHKDVIGGFAAGVDDFITKPYMADELVARVQAAERHLAATGGPPALAAALREADASAGGDVIVRDGATIGRILFHEGRVAWVHLSSQPGSLVDVLAGVVAPEDVRAVLVEAAASGCNFAEVLVEWHLITADALRDHMRGWLRAKLQAIFALDPWLVMFVPQRRGYTGDITFPLLELLPAGKRILRFAVAQTPATPVPSLEMWSSPRITAVLCKARVTAGLRVVAIFDAARGICVGIRGKPLDVALMLALTRFPYNDPASTYAAELVVVRERRYHLLSRAASQGYFVYLELDRGAANLGQARIVLRSLADQMAFDTA